MSRTNGTQARARSGRERDHQVSSQYADPDLVRGYASAYEGSGPSARYFRSRLHVVDKALNGWGGNLLDVGCGPGMLVRHLLDTRPGDFTITACDRSPAMIDAAAERVGTTDVWLTVGRIEAMPFSDRSFDVVLAMGVLDYADIRQALQEMARVVRPGGLALATMLNPLSPYRLVEWVLYWPALRMLGRLERLLGVPPPKRHEVRKSGIRARPAHRLRLMARKAGFERQDTVYYDVTAIPPPFDKLVRRWKREWRDYPERTVGTGFSRWLGSGYLIVSRRTPTDSAARF